MNENEFEADGVIYSAQPAVRGDADGLIGCDGCAVSYRLCTEGQRPKCNRGDRLDGKDVIFVEKHP